MSPVVLTFAPVAEHVRTARLVAVAVARRAGIDEGRLDDIRLAVGELCVRSVNRCASVLSRQSNQSARPMHVARARPQGDPAAADAGVGVLPWVIQVEVDDVGPRFVVSIQDPAGSVELPEDSVTLAMANALADHVELMPPAPNGLAVARLRWNRLVPAD